HLNLPTRVTIGGKNIDYTYDAGGVKLSKTVRGVATQYAGNYVYENGVLQFFNHPEGYVLPKNASDISQGFKYVYQYKDHLGNVRLSYTDNNNDGVITPSTEIIEESNYYPFGLKHKGYNNITSSLGNATAQKFKYQDQELEESLGYNMHEFELRHYDATIGRFVTTDPYEQFDNPYLAMGNNPVVSYDPDGGYCLDANGNQIACPEGDIFDEYRDSEDNHTTILPDTDIDAGATGSTDNAQGNEALYNQFEDKLSYDQIDWSKVFASEIAQNKMDLAQTSKDFMNHPITQIMFAIASGGGAASGTIATTTSVTSRASATTATTATSTAIRAVASTNVRVSTHAIQRLAQRGVTQKMVMKTVEKGEKFLDKKNGVITYILRNQTARGHSLKVSVSIHNKGLVTTVIKSSKSYNSLTKGLQKIN
ncbi:RHS repeat-associated core domain-containing protein, partial [Tenacibaculum maritimum]|uniref:RHS repeat-associated core domain-containing protein n=1 Tax=Tenacibaculum maritimum TaxID=107401 RepID=UPI00132FC0A8